MPFLCIIQFFHDFYQPIKQHALVSYNLIVNPKIVLGTEARSDGSTLLLSNYLIDSEDYYIILAFHQDTVIFKIFQKN